MRLRLRTTGDTADLFSFVLHDGYDFFDFFDFFGF
jgi:hypothetical protein